MTEDKIIRQTASVCPICLTRIPAAHILRDGGIYLEKTCPDHGAFSAIVWRNLRDIDQWRGHVPEMGADENIACPHACGLCAAHQNGTCCVLLEVTDRCNLQCVHCFADPKDKPDRNLEDILADLRGLAVQGETLVQLSGGEPTMRDDLPAIVAAAKKAGCQYVQLNTNGIRLAEDFAYVKALAEAGLSFVFMQFDSLRDETHMRLRGRALAKLKEQAIDNCAAHNIGVTLVPTLVPGVNTDQIGEILAFAVRQSPAVRGVHFQPVSHMGRVGAPPTDDRRFTLDQLLHAIDTQAAGLVDSSVFTPSCCDHPLCGFHGDFMVLPDHTLLPLNAGEQPPVQQPNDDASAADKNRAFVARRWLRGRQEAEAEGWDGASMDMDWFVSRVRSHGFTLTSMAFQDAGNLDIERLRQCSLHVYKDGALKPFCAHYLTPWGQE